MKGWAALEPDQIVEIVEYGEVIAKVKVVSDNRSEITVEDLETKDRSTFGHHPESGGWKLLFEGLGGEKCFNPRAASYIIRPV